ncbi:MAG TPA: cysteine desulfurase family protein [Anaerolineae bacterium]|nr:cysteine desulfurase family protein [Anaerolineae bacterium]HNU04072.1 cysteine desulfurase family protein [Anaerolineae bacterium]
MSDLIYLDHAATTPVRPEALAAMLPYFSQHYGNPSSLHRLGRETAKALRTARAQAAEVLGCTPGELVFTSSGTEADNLALRGVALARRQRGAGNHLIVSAVEHKGVLDTAFHLRDDYGFELTVLPVDAAGRVDPAHLAAAIRSDTAVVSIMAANNEVGTIQPLAGLSAVCRARGVPFHSDAVQASGALSLQVDELGVDLLSLGAHKFYGPKGVGLLYVRRGVPLWPQITGGSQEGKRRASTENVPYIVALATALVLAQAERAAEAARLAALRDRLIDGVLAAIADSYLTGHRTERLANHASFVVRGVEAEGMLIGLDMAGICASSGSACTSGAQEPSHVLMAMGVPRVDAAGHLRLSLGHSNSDADVDRLLAVLPPLVARLRELSPFSNEGFVTSNE